MMDVHEDGYAPVEAAHERPAPPVDGAYREAYWPYPFPALHGIAVSDAGELLLEGRTASSLLAEYGSPLVVMLEETIRANCREYLSRLSTYPQSKVFYASKAFLTTGMCKLIQSEGLGLDVVSAGELHTALSAGFPPQDITLHGNAKTAAELELAINAGVGRIALDNFDDIELLGEIAGGRLMRVPVQLRIAPGVKPDTHSYVQTGQIDSKFGLNIEGGAALAAAKRILELTQLKLTGLHCHIGSQIKEGSPFHQAADVMLRFYAELVHQHNAPLRELNLGGGLAVRYQPSDHPQDIAHHAAELAQYVLQRSVELDLDPPVLCDEPGRSIVAEAGVTLYTVQSTKVIPDVRNYVGVDGGMTDNPRFALYGARHACACANRLAEPHSTLWSVSGRCCESGDMLIKDAPLPEQLQRGDVLAFFSTGAYTYSMASNYNRIARPAVVLLGQGRCGMLARRETPEDVAKLDEVPAWLS